MGGKQYKCESSSAERENPVKGPAYDVIGVKQLRHRRRRGPNASKLSEHLSNPKRAKSSGDDEAPEMQNGPRNISAFSQKNQGHNDRKAAAGAHRGD